MYIPPKFTKRELDVIPLLVAGATRREIARHLKLSEETIKKYVRSLLTKFDATTLRDCIFDITDYYEQFIKGSHKFFVPHLKTTLHLFANYQDCEIVSEYDILAIKSGVQSVSELYHSDGHLPDVTVNGEKIDAIHEITGDLYRWNFPRELKPFETQGIVSKVRFNGAFGKNEERHFNNIADPTGHMSLGVVFHTDTLPNEVVYGIRQGIDDLSEISKLEHSTKNEFRIEVPRPGYQKRHYIKWIWQK